MLQIETICPVCKFEGYIDVKQYVSIENELKFDFKCFCKCGHIFWKK